MGLLRRIGGVWRHTVSDQSRARKNGFHILPGAPVARLNGWGKVLLFAVACFLAIMASGCRRNKTEPAAQSPVAHSVALRWNAPVSSPDTVAGYNIYRATGGGSFVRINSSPDSNVTYTDLAVTSGVTYSYWVTSVDFSGVESVPSNQITVTIP
jgi:hypothetical protein